MVKVMGDEGQGSTELMYVSATQAAQVISQLNQAASQEAFGRIITENMEVLGIDEAEYTEKAQVVSQVLYQQKPSGGYDVNSFTNGYQCACCIYELTQESAELDELLGALWGIHRPGAEPRSHAAIPGCATDAAEKAGGGGLQRPYPDARQWSRIYSFPSCCAPSATPSCRKSWKKIWKNWDMIYRITIR